MVIAQRLIDQMIDHARNGFPNEACGIVATRNNVAMHVYPMKNADESPVSYSMDSQEQLRVMLEIDDREWDLGAIFHSHTRTRAHPSPTDVRRAAYPQSLYIIVSLASSIPDVRAFRILGQEIREEPLQIVDESKPA